MPTPNAHAKLSASSAHRWLRCTAAPKNDADFWHRKVDEIPGDSIPVNHPAYRMSCTASSKYTAAKYMYKLLTEEVTPESDAVVCDVCTDNGHCQEYAPGKVCVIDRRDEHEAD